MAITAILPSQVLAAGASDGDLLTVQADGSVAFETPAGGGGIGGSTGATDNAVLRADGTDGDTLQGSVMSIADDGDIVINGRIEFDASTGRHGSGRSNAYNTYFLAGEQGLGLAFDGGWGGLKALGGIGDTGAELLSAGGITLKTGTGKGVHIGNGTDPKLLSVYNTYTSATSYERLEIAWDTNVATINTTAGSAGGTKRGLQICSAATDLLGLFGADPVDQPATVADPSGGSTVDTEARAAIAAVIDRLQEVGLIAT